MPRLPSGMCDELSDSRGSSRGVISSGRFALWAMLLWIWLLSARGRSGSADLAAAGFACDRAREPFRVELRDPDVSGDPGDLGPPAEVACGRAGREPDSRIRMSSLAGRAPDVPYRGASDPSPDRAADRASIVSLAFRSAVRELWAVAV
jgi:hypothetical protein